MDAQPQQQPQTAPTVLIADDEPQMLQMMSSALQAAGFMVVQASNGKQSLDMALQQHPALILTDNLMPIMTGIQMAAELRKDAWGAKVPVIIMTNLNDLNAVNQSLEAGVTDYIMKSDVGLDEIVAMVKNKLTSNG